MTQRTWTESGWVLEDSSNPPKYITVEKSRVCPERLFVWTDDHLKALRLARREDAEMLMGMIEDVPLDIFVREHVWTGKNHENLME